MNKCSFGQSKIEILGKTISSHSISPNENKKHVLLKNLKLPTTVKSLQRYIGLVNFHRQYIPKSAKQLIPLLKFLQEDTKFELNDTSPDSMFEINENLANAAKLSSKLPLLEKQLVIMCDASEHAAGYILTEDYTDTDEGPFRKP